ncbi:MAG TPA: hypothetical protein VGG08_00260 [Solirubrobacteraceae bacterium]|jgi:hypothetical protein
MLLVAATAVAVLTTRPHPASDTATAAALEKQRAAASTTHAQPPATRRRSAGKRHGARVRSGPGALPRNRAQAKARAHRAQASASWSTPATLSACPGRWPNVVFPSDKPSERTGPGAIVFNDGASCAGGAGARVAALGAEEQPLAPAKPHEAGGNAAISVQGPLLSTSGPHGQIVIAGLQPGSSGEGLIVQGTAGGPFTRLTSKVELSRPFALSTAYLGDAAVAMPDAGHGPLVQVERFFANRLGAARGGKSQGPQKAGGQIRDLTVAMDFRSDALAAWVQGTSVYAQDMPSSGVRHPVQRIGAAGPGTTLTALLSDDNRGMVVWQETSSKHTSVRFDYSGGGVTFGPATVLESYANPDGLQIPPTTPRLIRLSSESVMMAWAGVANGHWVVRTAAVDQNGIGTPRTIAAPEGDALLADLEPGPHGEAMLLFSEPQPSLAGKPDANRQALLTARGVDVAPDSTSFAEAQLVAPPGPVQGASIGIDPDNDDAVVTWEGEAGSIEYSVRASG